MFANCQTDGSHPCKESIRARFMKIIILGAGQVGSTVADKLACEENDITVVDDNNFRLKELQARLDIRTVHGKASFPSTLKKAGAEDADALVAVTNADEVNMIACHLAYTLFKTPIKIARIRQSDYLTKSKELFSETAIPIDTLISPEQLVTQYITRLIEYPGSQQVLDFADNKVQLVAVKADSAGPLTGKELQTIRDHMPHVDTRVAAIFRRGEAITPKGTTVIEADDEVFFIADRKHIPAVMSELQRLDHKDKRIIIAGGGNIGLRLAQALEEKYNVKVIEKNKERCEYLGRSLKNALVFDHDVLTAELLIEENIEETDVFIALTNSNESNVMSSLMAKKLGARKVIALINNPAFVDLFHDRIDITVSPELATISSILHHVRRGDVVNAHSLRKGGTAEAIEIIAHGDKDTSRIVGRRIGSIELPAGTTIGAIVRGDQVLIAHDPIELQSEDHVILFLTDKENISKVEKLFQVNPLYF